MLRSSVAPRSAFAAPKVADVMASIASDPSANSSGAPSALAPSSVGLGLTVSTKDAVLKEIALRIAAAGALDAGAVLDDLRSREALGSTGVGAGIAIPHARFASITRPIGAFIRLAKPVEFEAIDGAPVDLVFGLLTPVHCGNAHLQALARISRALRTPGLAATLRAAPDALSLHALVAPILDAGAAC
ncbi:PTS sugar transporter subunit IIA [Nitrospirillum pindoramense]|uniref:PTS system nitrogen regulatory IIA component n=1 Tax=Nitrospirillum amazonense TaxID=28077 RepID=A0A560H2P8_9PROT|nr:PTS sugar transporter subunit IIA [Nitrospirillum amazonense]TWB40411.1 PTS system nitrogen regulatory IIA component [Nitrospirillum amazonense]